MGGHTNHSALAPELLYVPRAPSTAPALWHQLLCKRELNTFPHSIIYFFHNILKIAYKVTESSNRFEKYPELHLPSALQVTLCNRLPSVAAFCSILAPTRPLPVLTPATHVKSFPCCQEALPQLLLPFPSSPGSSEHPVG